MARSGAPDVAGAANGGTWAQTEGAAEGSVQLTELTKGRTKIREFLSHLVTRRPLRSIRRYVEQFGQILTCGRVEIRYGTSTSGALR